MTRCPWYRSEPEGASVGGSDNPSSSVGLSNPRARSHVTAAVGPPHGGPAARTGDPTGGRPQIRLTPKGWAKRRYPTIDGPHAYVGNGPKGGGGCIDCGWPWWNRDHCVGPAGLPAMTRDLPSLLDHDR